MTFAVKCDILLSMNKLIKKVKAAIQKYKDRRPTRLPDGMAAFETWCQSLIDTYGFPDNDSVRFMFAAMIMNLKQTEAYVPKRYFALSGLAAASKEIAHGVMVELKLAQQARADAEAKAASQPKLTGPVSLVQSPTEATVPTGSFNAQTPTK